MTFRLILLGLLGFLVTAPVARAVVPDCLARFATFAEEDPAALIAQTYAELFTKLGGSRLTAETLNALRNGDPFHVPMQWGADVNTLRKSLAEFHRMLTKKGWDRPELLHPIRHFLTELVSQKVGAVDALDKALKLAGADELLPLPSGTNRLAVSPDARWLVIHNISYGQGYPLHWYDSKTGTWRETHGISNFSVNPIFSKHGNALLYATGNSTLTRVPFSENGPDFATAVSLKPTNPGGIQLHFVETTDPDRVYGSGTQSSAPEFVFDFKSQTAVPIDLTKLTRTTWLGKERIVREWGSVPGTPHLYLYLHENGFFTGKRVLRVIKIADDGKATEVGSPLTLHFGKKYTGPHGVILTTDGKKPLARDSGEIWFYNAATPTPKPVGTIGAIRQVAVSPNGKRIAVIKQAYEEAAPYTIDWIDAESEKLLNSTRLPSGTDPRDMRILPGGEILLRDATNDRVIVLRRHGD